MQLVKYTPFGDLVEGDEYTRLGNRPVLLRDMPGEREGDWWYWREFRPNQPFPIYRLGRNSHGVLGEQMVSPIGDLWPV